MFQYAKFVLNMVNSPEFKLPSAFCTRAHYLKMATSICIVYCFWNLSFSFLWWITWGFFSHLFITFWAIFWLSDCMLVVKIQNSLIPSSCFSLSALRWALLIYEILVLKGRCIYTTFYNIWWNTGLSGVMDCSLHALRQCGNVERKVWELGTPVLRTTILSSSLFPSKFLERWISNPHKCSSLWSSSRTSNSACIEHHA
jgi:hypothetical protein